MTDSTTDPVATYLARVRDQNERTAASVALRGWSSSDDAWDEAGPMGLAEWSAGRQAAEILRLLAAVEAVLAQAANWSAEPVPSTSHAGSVRAANTLRACGDVLKRAIPAALLGEER